MKSYDNIQKLLLSSKNASILDQACFHAWERGEMSTAKCLKKFREHNRQDDRISVSLSDFESWLYSLGYRRY